MGSWDFVQIQGELVPRDREQKAGEKGIISQTKEAGHNGGDSCNCDKKKVQGGRGLNPLAGEGEGFDTAWVYTAMRCV